MKKFRTTNKYKRINKTRSKKRLRNKIKRKYKKYNPNKQSRKSKSNKKKKIIKSIDAPNRFSLIENTEEVLEYYELAESFLKEGYPVRFDISKISTLTSDAIALQIAKIKDPYFNRNGLILGNAPQNPNLQQLFYQSGFFNHVQTKGPKPKYKDTLIHKVTKNKVEPQLAKEACLIGLRHTFQSEEIFDPMFDILIEIMQNTNNHAGKRRGEYDWWLHIFKEPNTKISKYTFLDLGVGIFESLPAKSYWRKFGESLGLTHNANLVSPLFDGKIKSRTRKPERGKGIPQVYLSSQHGAFNKFLMISNNVYVNMKNMKVERLKNQLSGTLFYWELKK